MCLATKLRYLQFLPPTVNHTACAEVVRQAAVASNSPGEALGRRAELRKADAGQRPDQ